MQKITILSNEKITIPISLKNLESNIGLMVNEGNNYIFSDEKDNNWFVKILSNIMPIKYFINKEKEEIIGCLLESVDFLAKEGLSNFKKLIVQINNKVDVNRNFIKINKDKNIIFLGLESLKIYKKNNSKNMLSHILFHEFSHSLFRDKPNLYDDTPLTNYDLFLNKFFSNYYFDENFFKEFNNVDKKIIIPFINGVSKFYEESYADISALLILRNKLIEDSKYSEKAFNLIIEELIELRKNNTLEYFQEFKNKSNTDKNFFEPLVYSTNISAEELNLQLKNLLGENNNKKLNAKEIHLLTRNCSKIGLAKFLHIALNEQSKKYNQFCLSTLVKKILHNQNYDDFWKEILELVPDNNKNKLKKILTEINVLNISQSSYLIFIGLTDYQCYRMNIENNIIKNNYSIEKFDKLIQKKLKNEDSLNLNQAKINDNIFKVKKQIFDDKSEKNLPIGEI